MDLKRIFGIGVLLLTIIGLCVYFKQLKTTAITAISPTSSVPTVTNPLSSLSSILSTESETLTHTVTGSTGIHSEPSMMQYSDEDISERPNVSRKKSLESGCVVGFYYNDQQIGSLPNILSFQCWAVTVNMSVVEPVMISSKFGAPLTSKQMNDNVRFSQIFNIEHFSEAHPDPPLASLISWEDFLDNAPRDVILVSFGEGWIQQNSPLKNCSLAHEQFAGFLIQHEFRVVREVCVEHVSPMTIKTFNSFVLGNYTSNVSVIFSEWGGIDGSRIKITDSKCHRTIFKSILAEGLVNSSGKLIQDANTYINKYFHNAEFISVMVRSEYLVRSSLLDEHSRDLRAFPACLEAIEHAWMKLKQHAKTNATLLSFDWGRFGSMFYNVYRKDIFDIIMQDTDKFFKFIYGNSTITEEWEQSFIDVSGISNPGYIAMLQKSIAVRAKCIVLGGGGRFQEHALTLYKQLHPRNQCYMDFGKTCSLEDLST